MTWAQGRTDKRPEAPFAGVTLNSAGCYAPSSILRGVADGSQVTSILAAAKDGEFYAVQLQTEARGTHWVRFTEGAAREITEVLRRYLANQSLEGPLTLTVSTSHSAARADGRKAIVLQTREWGPIALEVNKDVIETLQRQLSALQAVQEPTAKH